MIVKEKKAQIFSLSAEKRRQSYETRLVIYVSLY